MKILPPSQINNLPIMEEVLEELRLSILDHIQEIGEVLDLYSLATDNIKKKLNLLGLNSVTIGKFINISLSDKEFEYISPAFYKGYRKLNEHRGNKMSMDYVLHSAGMMNTLVHSNPQFYNQDIFSNAANFFEFNTFRDNQLSELGIGDGYIIVPYTTNRSQVLKQYLAKNPIIFEFLPAGYTFVFLSEYRNGYDNGVHQYDNYLSFLDTINTHPTGYYKPLYWEDFNIYPDVEEILILDDGSEFTYNHTLYYYDPYLFRDKGIKANLVDYPRFTYDQVYEIPLFGTFGSYVDELFINAQLYFNAYNDYLIQEVVLKWAEGLEADLNNTLNYRDVWLGDYLLSALQGSTYYPEFYDHVKGLVAPWNASSSMASLYQRGETLASQYWQREDKIVSVLDHDIQINKKEIITDRKEIDLFRYSMVSDVELRLEGFYDREFAKTLLRDVFGFGESTLNYLVDNAPARILNGIDYNEASDLFNQLINVMHTLETPDSNDVIFSVIDGRGVVVLTNNNPPNKHIELSENETGVLNRVTQKVEIEITANM